MKFIVALLWLVIALPLGAQPTQAQYDSLKLKVAALEKIVGKWDTRPDLAVPCVELPNGECPINYRQRQIGLAIDGAVNAVYGFATRLAAVESRSGLGRTIRADSLILGTCARTDIASQLAICGQHDANIHVESNLSSTQYQNPAPHVGMWSLSGDGGMRRIQNGYLTTNCFDDVDPTNGVHYQNCLKRFVDPTREYGQEGFDSRASWSLVRSLPGVSHEYTQDVVLMIDPATKTISFESWQSGWRWAFVTSSCRACRDQRVPIQ